MSEDMTWDDGLSLDALGQYLRRHNDAEDAMPLLLYCIDCSRFLRHVARANISGSDNRMRESKSKEELQEARNALVERFLQEDSSDSLSHNIRVVLPSNVVHQMDDNISISDKVEVLSLPSKAWRLCSVVDLNEKDIKVRYEQIYRVVCEDPVDIFAAPSADAEKTGGRLLKGQEIIVSDVQHKGGDDGEDGEDKDIEDQAYLQLADGRGWIRAVDSDLQSIYQEDEAVEDKSEGEGEGKVAEEWIPRVSDRFNTAGKRETTVPCHEVSDDFLQAIRAEAQHLLVVNYFADFLQSPEYTKYLEKERILKDSRAELDATVLTPKRSSTPLTAPDRTETGAGAGAGAGAGGGASPSRISVVIPSTVVNTDSSGKPVVQYQIETCMLRQASADSQGGEEEIEGFVSVKRYSEFYDLNNLLRKRYSKMAVVAKGALPSKGTPGKHQLTPAFREERQVKLEEYLQQVVAVPELSQDSDVLDFLCVS